MKIKIIEPVIINDENEIIKEEKYLREYISKETQIDFDVIELGFESIESEVHAAFNAPEIILKAKKAEEEGYDGVFVNCFDDPGVYSIREIINIPVFGGYLPSVVTAASLTERIGIIKPNQNGVFLEERKAKHYGFENKIVTVENVGLGVLELNKKEVLLERLINICIEMIEKENVHVLVFGCTGMSYIAKELRQCLKDKGYSVTIVEPLAAGVKYLEYIIQLGFTNTLNYKISLDTLKWIK